MSYWREEESETHPGRIEITIGTNPFDLLMPMVFVLGLLGTMAASVGPALPLAILTTGFALFLIAKLSIIRQGILLSWGSRRMSRGFRTCYRLGYGLMTAGVLIGATGLMFGMKMVQAPLRPIASISRP